MKVMLTPPDIWGSTGYVSQGQDTEDDTDNMYKVGVSGNFEDIMLMNAINLLQVRQIGSEGEIQWGSGDNNENQSIILINRQRQVLPSKIECPHFFKYHSNKVF